MLVNIVQGTGQSPTMKRHRVGRPVSTEVEKLVFGKLGVVVMYPWGCYHHYCCLEGAHEVVRGCLRRDPDVGPGTITVQSLHVPLSWVRIKMPWIPHLVRRHS